MTQNRKQNATQHARKLMDLLPLLHRGLSRREDNLLTRGKISFPQLLAMEHLLRHGRCRMGELARVLSIRMASATGLVDRMMRSRFVNRFSDPQDRRVVRIGLTAKGQRVVKTIFSQKERIMSEVFMSISDRDADQYVRLFQKIVYVLSGTGEKGGRS